MSSSAVVPRVTALTPIMELTGPDGVQWIAYVEGFPPVRRWRLLSQTLLPGRRMRFDSADESRVCPTVPAGSPFLSERRLLTLLAESTSLPQSEPALPTPLRSWQALGAAVRTGRSWICDTAASVSRTALHRVLSGYRMYSGRRAMAHHR